MYQIPKLLVVPMMNVILKNNDAPPGGFSRVITIDADFVTTIDGDYVIAIDE